MPCKPWPFGNEYRMVCCSLLGILWQLELVEEKDARLQIIPTFNNIERTVGLLLLMLGSPSLERAMLWFLTVGFVPRRELFVELKEHGVYTSALIKKWKYWPEVHQE